MSFLAAYYRRVDDVVIKATEFASMTEDEVVVRVDACGICGTDVNAILRGTAAYVRVGHEVAGRLLDETGAPTARRVVLESSSACGRCASCRNGLPSLCTDVRSFFKRPYLGIAERMLAPKISVVDYDGLDPAVATLSEPLGVALDLCDVAQVALHSVVLVVGLGPIGLMAVRLARLAGARRIYASTFSRNEKRNALALEFGADELLYEDDTPLARRKLDPAPDRILSTAPPVSLGDSVPVAATGALIAFIGVGHGDSDRVVLPGNRFHFKKLQLRSSFAAPALRTPLALDLLRAGRIAGERLISHRFPLQDAAEAIRVACTDKKDAIKVVIVNA